MGKMEQVLKSEIVRLARKEIRATCVPLARDVRRLKRQVSRLKKTVDALEKLKARLEEEVIGEKAKLEAPPQAVRAARFSPQLIKKLRKRLGVSQGELAVLARVSSSAVAAWEQARARPKGRNREALVALRGLGKREVKRILAERMAGPEPPAKKPKKPRKEARGSGTRRLPAAKPRPRQQG